LNRRVSAYHLPVHRLASALAVSLAITTAGAVADEVPQPSRGDAIDPARQQAPDPTRGDTYDGRAPDPSAGEGALWVPRVLLFPVRALFLAFEPPAQYATELEQRHHLYLHVRDLSTSRDGLIGVRPEVQYSLDFRPSFGLRFFDDRAFGYETTVNALAMGGPGTARGEIWARPTPFSWPVQVAFGSVYDRRNDRLFAGIDNTVPVQYGQLGPSRYQSDNLDVDATVGFRLAAPLTLSVAGAFGWKRFGNGYALSGDPPIEDVYCVRGSNGDCFRGTINPLLVPGFIEGTRFFRGSAALTLDLRDSPSHSTVGFLLTAAADYSHGIGSDTSSYFRLYGAATLPINLWAHRNVLLFRFSTEAAAAVGDAIIPFSELPTLGGSDDLRGFRYQLFHGHTSILATAEYRFPIWMWMDAAVFVDYGGVFQQWYGGIGASRMQPDLGAALRLFGRDRFYLRLQLAYGWGEGWRFTLSTLNWP
jgi:hypothetical protein